MSWIANKQENAEPMTAKKNIHVKKLVVVNSEGRIFSPYVGHEYHLNKLEESTIECAGSGKGMKIYDGLHSYSWKTKMWNCVYPHADNQRSIDAINVSRSGAVANFFIDKADIKACLSKCVIGNGEHIKFMVMHCIIPSGAKYYVNDKMEYVSDKIIPIKLAKIK